LADNTSGILSKKELTMSHSGDLLVTGGGPVHLLFVTRHVFITPNPTK
jgi:hypothetical protein